MAVSRQLLLAWAGQALIQEAWSGLFGLSTVRCCYSLPGATRPWLPNRISEAWWGRHGRRGRASPLTTSDVNPKVEFV